MKRVTALVLALLVAAPVFAQQYDTRCWVKGGDGSRKHYVCASGDGVPTIVARTWFKAHCTTVDPATEADTSSAWCNTGVEPITAGETMATPPGFWHHVKVGFEVAGVTALVIIVLASGGGGAWQ